MVQQMALPDFTSQLLFVLPPVDERDELAERLEKDFTLVTSIQNGSSQKEGRDKLSQAATQSMEKYVDLMDGLVYGILTDPAAAERFLGDMTVLSMLNAEAFGPVTKTLNLLMQDKFGKLSEVAKKQSVWLMFQMTKSGIANLDRIHIPFMRNLTAGENWKNIPLLETYMKIFTENRSFFETPAGGPIVQMAVLTFIQLIQYHHPLQYSVIKDKEMDFCLDLLRSRFNDLILVGRELTRSLMAICKMPKMKDFWSDLVANPKNLSPTAGGVPQLLQSKTPRWLFTHRISYDLETKVTFLLTKVRAAQLARYSDIFIKQYLSSPESDVLLPELIRFVIRTVHPSNEILGSDVLQRWNFIMILLTACKTVQGLNNCLLALFYDWILFDGVENNIMNIEPAILLLMNLRLNGIRVLQKPLLVILIDYLCKIPFEFYPPIAAKIRKCVVDSFSYVLEKRVIQSLNPIFESVPEDVKTSLRKSFPENFGEDPTGPRLNALNTLNTVNVMNVANGNGKLGVLPVSGSVPVSVSVSVSVQQKTPPPVVEVDASFPEVEEEIPFVPPKVSLVKRSLKSYENNRRAKPSQQPSLAQCIDVLPESLQPLFCTMRDGTDEEKCAAMEEFVVEVINEGQNVDTDDCELLSRALALTFKPIYDRFVMPEPFTEETFEDSIQSPLFILFRRLWEEVIETPARSRILTLLAEMSEIMPDLGFLLVYYMMYRDSKVRNEEERDSMADFEDFCFSVRRKLFNEEKLDEKNYVECLGACLDRCGLHDHKMLIKEAEFIFRETPKVSKDSSKIFKAVIVHVDVWEVKTLSSLILQKRLVMFTEKGCGDVIRESLKWETIEQTFFWKLFHAHGFKGDAWLLELLKEIDFKKHPEAAMQVFDALRGGIPREEVLREVLRREPDDGTDRTFITLAVQWSLNNSPAELAESFAKMIAKLVHKKRATNKHSTPVKGDLTLEHVLGHIASIQLFVAETDRVGGNKKSRDDLTQMLYQASLEVALRRARESVTPSVLDRFREVFSLITDDDNDDEAEVKILSPKKKKNSEEKVGGDKGGGKKRSAGGKRAVGSSPSSASSRQSSDEETTEVLTSKVKKARNKSPAQGEFSLEEEEDGGVILSKARKQNNSRNRSPTATTVD